MLRRSSTAVIERNAVWEGRFETEPYEAGWASEAIFFVRILENSGGAVPVEAKVQISPDGMHWCDEGTKLRLGGEPGGSFAKVKHFGGFLRLCGEAPPSAKLQVIVYLALKE